MNRIWAAYISTKVLAPSPRADRAVAVRKQTMEKLMIKDQLMQSLKQFVETHFWPRHRGLDEAMLLMLPEADGPTT